MKSLYAGYADQAELDKAYDVENSVPDFGMYAQKFTSESEAARAALTLSSQRTLRPNTHGKC